MDSRLHHGMIRLTPREQDIIELLLLGYDITEISKHLSIAPRTVKAHFGRIYLRFGIMGGIKRVKLATLLLSKGLIPSEPNQSPVSANERERQMIKLVAQGLNNRQMATVMGTSEHVIKNDLKSIYDRLGVWNRLELALWYEGHQHQELVN
ncbi:MAG TPA: helix-turn-helix transcriptional regulator [Candidatus Sulfotelmatobacter sp.]|nr:helix-turn-helix transcriptional regulator [Candidatus Sulfotelmatobacter sp.]